MHKNFFVKFFWPFSGNNLRVKTQISFFTHFMFQALVKFGKNFLKIVRFCHFCLISKICLNSCKVYLKHAPKFFFEFFWPFLAIVWGAKHICPFSPFFFSSTCTFGQNSAIGPKFWIVQISKYACFFPKKFWGSYLKYWR